MKTRFFALATLALVLAACNNDNENLNGDPVAAQFTADIALATRASGTTWDNGDRIGITDIGNDTQYGNVPFILKNGKFEAEGKVIYIEDTKTHTFRAYYPYNAAGGILTATTDATAQQNQPAIDFLFASGATGDKNNPVVRDVYKRPVIVVPAALVVLGLYIFKACPSPPRPKCRPSSG